MTRTQLLILMFGSFQSVVGLQIAQAEAAANDGRIRTPAMTIPYSDLASPEAKSNFVEMMRARSKPSAWSKTDIRDVRRGVEEEQRPGVMRLRAAFPVVITAETIGGIHSAVIVPSAGQSSESRHRVLINLHGGSMLVAAGNGALEESIPIASVGQIKVITVDYRMAPEAHFPAASEDVASVYRELLKSYLPENIGFYGCSSGAVLAAQSVAWFMTHGLPRPGAIGLFGEGAMDDGRLGDGLYAAVLGGNAAPKPASVRHGRQNERPSDWNYVGSATPTDPLVSPAYHPEVLKAFPPTLLISGTRDLGLSKIVYTHAKLVDVGVDAELHVWEGATHCSFAQGLVDPDVPETREAWKVITRFFSKHLGQPAPAP